MKRHRAPAIALFALASLIPLAFIGVFFIWPVTAMVIRGVSGWELATLTDVLGTPRTWRILANTLLLAVAGTLGSVVLGIPGAYILYRTRFRGQQLLRSIVSVPFVLPTIVVGSAFRALLAPSAPLGWLGLDQSHAAVIAAMVFFNFSVTVRTVGNTWAMLDPRAADAAATLGANRTRVFTTITLPALTPAIATSGGLTFLYCSTAYGLVRSLGTPGVGTLETEIFRQTNTFLDLDKAAVFSLIQLIIVLASVWCTQALTHRTVQANTVTSPHRVKLSRADAVPATITALTIFGLILAPMLALVIRSFQDNTGAFSLHNYRMLASYTGDGFAGGATVLQALEHSLKIAGDATLITLVMAIILALLMTRPLTSRIGRAVQRGFDALVMLPLGVSAVTIGFGFIISLQVAFPTLAQSGALVALAQSVVALPLVVRSLLPILRGIDPRLREAAALLGASPWRTLITIDGAFLARGIGLAAGFSFAVSVGEFGATSFLASPSYQTLPLVIVRLLGRPGSDNFGMAMAAAVILAALSAALLLICERLKPPEPRGHYAQQRNLQGVAA